ncbi:hypothetical protein A4A49_18936 [Nicotiana attenuata]|uniref:Uncharacterized protein n=1 Tax=Nicotiana attenuata TaxID=49451 RepID=A0A1J6KUC8_NICAT|nr:hypothetical protein A4A49_18936 [Nicotiana attenuata]
MNMVSLKVVMFFTLLLIWKGNAAPEQPCQQPGDCHLNCGDDAVNICLHNTCLCQRCTNFFPPSPSDESFVIQDCSTDHPNSNCNLS